MKRIQKRYSEVPLWLAPLPTRIRNRVWKRWCYLRSLLDEMAILVQNEKVCESWLRACENFLSCIDAATHNPSPPVICNYEFLGEVDLLTFAEACGGHFLSDSHPDVIKVR